jgi:hypothetical protein
MSEAATDLTADADADDEPDDASVHTAVTAPLPAVSSPRAAVSPKQQPASLAEKLAAALRTGDDAPFEVSARDLRCPRPRGVGNSGTRAWHMGTMILFRL